MLIIDPGHGGTDGGAQGNGISEKEYTLKISLYQLGRFQALGVPVKMTRTTDSTLPPNKRAPLVKNSGATYCISNHLNAGGGVGFEIIHSIFNPNPPFAEYLRQEFTQAGNPLHAIYSRKGSGGKDYYYMHRQTGAVKTYIVEYSYVDTASDAARIKAHWQTYAEAVVKAYCRLIKHPYNAPNHQPEPQPNPPGSIWVVQAGAFGNRQNADELAARMKKSGFDSFIYRK